MVEQLQISFDSVASRQLAVVGMELAKESANQKEKGWSKICWQLFLVWLRRKPRYSEFMIEEFRKYLYEYDLITKPPTDRAYGFLSKRAEQAGFIEFSRIAKTTGKSAHSANASVWRKK